METERGRWFLAEYAGRNRRADTAEVLAAIDRLTARHAAAAARQPDAAPSGETGAMIDRLRAELADMAGAIARTKTEIAAIRPDAAPGGRIMEATEQLDSVVRTTERATSEILAAAEQVQEVAWTMREQGMESEFCDKLDSYATDIYTACSFQDITGQRTRKIIHVLRYLEARIQAMNSIWGAANQVTTAVATEVATEAATEATAEVTAAATAEGASEVATPADSRSERDAAAEPAHLAAPAAAMLAPAEDEGELVWHEPDTVTAPPVPVAAQAVETTAAPPAEIVGEAGGPVALPVPDSQATAATDVQSPLAGAAHLNQLTPDHEAAAAGEAKPPVLTIEGPAGSFSIMAGRRAEPQSEPTAAARPDAPDAGREPAPALAAETDQAVAALRALAANFATKYRGDGEDGEAATAETADATPPPAADSPPAAEPASTAPALAVAAPDDNAAAFACNAPAAEASPLPAPAAADALESPPATDEIVLPPAAAPKLGDLPQQPAPGPEPAPAPPRKADIVENLFADVMALTDEERIALFT
jgi:chemotaxis protein CheZ